MCVDKLSRSPHKSPGSSSGFERERKSSRFSVSQKSASFSFLLFFSKTAAWPFGSLGLGGTLEQLFLNMVEVVAVVGAGMGEGH